MSHPHTIYEVLRILYLAVGNENRHRGRYNAAAAASASQGAHAASVSHTPVCLVACIVCLRLTIQIIKVLLRSFLFPGVSLSLSYFSRFLSGHNGVSGSVVGGGVESGRGRGQIGSLVNASCCSEIDMLRRILLSTLALALALFSLAGLLSLSLPCN